MAYYEFINEDGTKYGSFETFHSMDVGTDCPEWHADQFDPDEEVPPAPFGWYWWACSPGCIPDGEPFGPFETEGEAIDDANNYGEV